VSTRVELLTRPWGSFTDSRRVELADGADIHLEAADCAFLFHQGEDVGVVCDGRRETLPRHATFRLGLQDRGALAALPRPKTASSGQRLAVVDHRLRLSWAGTPDQPRATGADADDEPAAAAAMAHVQRVVMRILEVRTALDGSPHLWAALSRIWDETTGEEEPDRDIIVRHARLLAPVFAELLRQPRKVLQRVRRMTPVSRVQEMDRASMLWLSRQPGTNTAERAGPSQRVLAPTRVETADTLENRVLRSTAELSAAVARDYVRRNARARGSQRWRAVDRYRRTCLRAARTLREAGVRQAPTDVVPNYVLQNDVRYRQIWEAYVELRRRHRERDELWRWQARTWEEFCALAVVVALLRLPGARLVAAAPLEPEEEQDRGLWLRHDNPLAAFFLPRERLVVEVQIRQRKTSAKDRLGAPIWLRIGDFSNDFLKYVAIWPLHAFRDVASVDEAREIAEVLEPFDPKENVVGGVVLRPLQGGPQSEAHLVEGRRVDALCASLGVDGAGLRDGLAHLATFCARFVGERATAP
jgi:hypothetical protein